MRDIFLVIMDIFELFLLFLILFVFTIVFKITFSDIRYLFLAGDIFAIYFLSKILHNFEKHLL